MGPKEIQGPVPSDWSELTEEQRRAILQRAENDIWLAGLRERASESMAIWSRIIQFALVLVAGFVLFRDGLVELLRSWLQD